jgi:hypothetical protein
MPATASIFSWMEIFWWSSMNSRYIPDVNPVSNDAHCHGNDCRLCPTCSRRMKGSGPEFIMSAPGGPNTCRYYVKKGENNVKA